MTSAMNLISDEPRAKVIFKYVRSDFSDGSQCRQSHETSKDALGGTGTLTPGSSLVPDTTRKIAFAWSER